VDGVLHHVSRREHVRSVGQNQFGSAPRRRGDLIPHVVGPDVEGAAQHEGEGDHLEAQDEVAQPLGGLGAHPGEAPDDDGLVVGGKDHDLDRGELAHGVKAGRRLLGREVEHEQVEQGHRVRHVVDGEHQGLVHHVVELALRGHDARQDAHQGLHHHELQSAPLALPHQLHRARPRLQAAAGRGQDERGPPLHLRHAVALSAGVLQDEHHERIDHQALVAVPDRLKVHGLPRHAARGGT